VFINHAVSNTDPSGTESSCVWFARTELSEPEVRLVSVFEGVSLRLCPAVAARTRVVVKGSRLIQRPPHRLSMAPAMARRLSAWVAVALACVIVMPAIQAAKTWPGQLSTKDGGEVFLKGRYIEVGMHSAGSFGTSNLPTTSGFNGKSGADYSWSYGMPCTVARALGRLLCGH